MSDYSPTDQRALRAVAMQFFLNGAVMASYTPRLPEIRDALGTDLSTIGQIITGASLAGLLGSWLSARVLGRFGTRSTMIYGTIGLILLLPLAALATSVWSLLLVLAALMLVDVLVDVAMNMQGSNLSARRTTPVMNRLHGLWSIGTVVGGSLAASMAAMSVPLFWHLLGTAFLMLVGLWYIGGGLLTTDHVPNKEQEAHSAENSARIPLSLWVFGLLGAMAFIPEMIGANWSAFRLHDDLHTNIGVAGMGFVVFNAGMMIGRLGGDWVAARMTKGRLLNYATLITSIGFTLACLVDVVPLIFIGFAIAGLGISVLFPSLYDAAAQDPQRPGAALGAMTAGSRIAMLGAPTIIGFLADLDMLSVGIAMIVLALPCLLTLRWLSMQAFGRHSHDRADATKLIDV